jgi:Holliday junction resolvase RusA-like endonuclease
MRTEFFMAMIPPTVTHQEKDIAIVKDKKTGKMKPVVYEPTELEAARAKLTAHLAKHIPEVKYTKACRAIVKWCFPITGNHYNGEYKDTKPDTHNLDKMLFDIMEDLGYWDNDARVASEIIEKFYANIPGIYICIEGPLDGGDIP